MSYLSSQFIKCETLQKQLDDEFLICKEPYEAMPLLETVLAGQNAANISQEVTPGDGKVLNVKVIYEQRLLESETTQGSGKRTCVADTKRYNNYQMYTIDPLAWIKAEEQIETIELVDVCSDDVASRIRKSIARVVDALERRTATKTAIEAVALYGKWGQTVSNVNGSDELVVQTMISEATKQIDDAGMLDIAVASQQTGYCAPHMIIGGTAMYKYGLRVEKGCCSTTGVNILDMANTYGKAIMYDKRVAAALGTENKSLMFQSGSLGLIHYTESKQIPNIGGNYIHMVVYGSRTGLPIDIRMKDDCGTISIVGFVNTKLVGLPLDMFKIGDEYRGVNYVNKILVTNPA